MGGSPYPFAGRLTLDLIPTGYQSPDTTTNLIFFDDTVDLLQWPWSHTTVLPWRFFHSGPQTSVLTLTIIEKNVIRATHPFESGAIARVIYSGSNRPTAEKGGRCIPDFDDTSPVILP